MIVKILINTEDGMEECFEITNYYKEEHIGDKGEIFPYIEADINGDGTDRNGQREIVLDSNQYLGESDEWESLTIITDGGFELFKTERLEVE